MGKIKEKIQMAKNPGCRTKSMGFHNIPIIFVDMIEINKKIQIAYIEENQEYEKTPYEIIA